MEPIWKLPTVIIHDAAVQTMGGLPWQIADCGIDTKIWPKLDGAPKVRVGIIDTGVGKKALQGELQGVVVEASDFSNSEYGHYDLNGHGTHVAGIIGAKSFGVAKDHVELVVAKALGEGGSGNDRAIANAADYCRDKGCKILNMSLGSSMPSSRINGMLKELAQEGILIAVAAGNDGGEVNWPAQCDWVLAVSALDQRRRLADFSCRGSAIDVAAPGVEIPSLGLGTGLAIMSGTSMATPWVAGYLADVFAVYARANLAPPKTVDEALKWLIGHSIDLGSAGIDPEYGAGLPDPEKFGNSIPAPGPAQPLPPPVLAENRPVAGTITLADGTTWRPTDWERVA